MLTSINVKIIFVVVFESSFDVRSIGIKLQIEGYPIGIVTFTILVVPDIAAAATHAECARFDVFAVAEFLGRLGVAFDLEHVRPSHGLRRDDSRRGQGLAVAADDADSRRCIG